VSSSETQETRRLNSDNADLRLELARQNQRVFQLQREIANLEDRIQTSDLAHKQQLDASSRQVYSPSRADTVAAVAALARTSPRNATTPPRVSPRHHDDGGVSSVLPVGIGALFTDSSDSQVVVSALTSDGPAMRRGIRVGDVVVAVNGVRGLTADEAAALCKGRPNTDVVLRVVPQGSAAEVDLRLTRAFVSTSNAVWQ